MTSFGLSACVHLLVGLILALILIETEQDQSHRILATSVSELDSPNQELEITPSQPEQETEESVSIVSDVPLPNFGTTSAQIPQLDTTVPNLATDQTDSKVNSQIAAAFVSDSTNSDGISLGPKSKASFFGAEAEGNRFVYVIDSSRSMEGPRWEALCRELIRSIRSLSPDQKFFIIGFDSSEHPMFDLVPNKGAFLPPSPDNLSKVAYWLASFQHGNATLPSTSIGIAMRLEPDAIFLLSDGEIADNTVNDLRIWNHKKGAGKKVKTITPIHTVLLHSQIGFATLQTIASENSVTFTPVRAF
jgi:hypothetical protein